MKTPDCVCKTPEEYIRVALAIETLAYHDKKLSGQLFGKKRYQNQRRSTIAFD